MDTIASAMAGPAHKPYKSQCKPNAVPKENGIATYVTFARQSKSILTQLASLAAHLGSACRKGKVLTT